MTRASPKYPSGLSDSSLMALWRRAVLKHYGYRCVICGGDGTLEAHHCIKRRYKLLRYDWRNGVPVHPGDCHAEADRMGVGAAGPEYSPYLMALARDTFKRYLQSTEWSEAEWRGRVKAALLAELAGREKA